MQHHLGKAWKLAFSFLQKANGFTLAEVLITLGIIGVVAAMTLPTLVNKMNGQATVTKIKKTYSILNQALRLSVADHQDVKHWTYDVKNDSIGYVDKYWRPYLKKLKICTDRAAHCGYDDNRPFKYMDGRIYDLSVLADDRKSRTLFVLADGVYVWIYTGSLNSDESEINFVEPYVQFDINGPQRPNVVGQDVFIMDIDKEKNLLIPLGHTKKDHTLETNCSKEGRGDYCLEKLLRDGWKSKNYPWYR